MARFIVTRDVRSKVAVEADDAQKAQELVKAGKGDVINHDETFRASEDKPLKFGPTSASQPPTDTGMSSKTASRK